ncbi:hypothetical protein M0805_009642 [Coniferiporia weirii]|nr:hypothetical protein M0805_009642 [Coniferiporia weirii]
MLDLLRVAKTYLAGLVTGGDSARSVLPFVPRPLRLLFILLLVLNSRSLPFIWHFRTFRPVLYVRLKWLSLSFSSQRTKDAYLDSLSSVGKSPFSLRSTYNTWASPDESDYNAHLSNSSYAKVLDMLRLKFAIAHVSTVFRDGCWIALGATHLRFVREIPIGTKYEIRMYMGSWDNKWVYAVARFVSKGKSSSDDSKVRQRLQDASSTLASGASSSSMPFPQLHTPASGDISSSGSATPNPEPKSSLISSASELEALWKEAPGETLHCIAINELCFKSGRVTVPPALVFAAAGCGLDADAWARVNQLRNPRANGSGKEKGKSMREFMRSAWRDVPVGSRWWDDAMAPFEAERVRRLAVLKGVQEGLDAARFL